MGITRFTTKVVLSTGAAEPSTGAAVVGLPVWIVDYTVTENRREMRFRVRDYSEPGARRMVANLLQNIQPGLRVEDVYSEQLG